MEKFESTAMFESNFLHFTNKVLQIRVCKLMHPADFFSLYPAHNQNDLIVTRTDIVQGFGKLCR